MKLSETMLNFLGYLTERAEEGNIFFDVRGTRAMVTNYGEATALKNKLLEPHIDRSVISPGFAALSGMMPGPIEREGYRLTAKGLAIGAYGKKLRVCSVGLPFPSTESSRLYTERRAAILAEAQAALNAMG